MADVGKVALTVLSPNYFLKSISLWSFCVIVQIYILLKPCIKVLNTCDCQSDVQGARNLWCQRFRALFLEICTPSLFSPSPLCGGILRTKQSPNRIWHHKYLSPCVCSMRRGIALRDVLGPLSHEWRCHFEKDIFTPHEKCNKVNCTSRKLLETMLIMTTTRYMFRAEQRISLYFWVWRILLLGKVIIYWSLFRIHIYMQVIWIKENMLVRHSNRNIHSPLT